MPFGQWAHIAGGSAAQTVVPLYAIWQFLRQEDYFAASFGFAWLAESLNNLAIYIGDARAQELPLANLFGGEPIHDWNFLLTDMGKLASDAKIAADMRFAAFVSVVIFLWLGTWLLWQMFRTKAKAS